jgi:hypothetical protein
MSVATVRAALVTRGRQRIAPQMPMRARGFGVQRHAIDPSLQDSATRSQPGAKADPVELICISVPLSCVRLTNAIS